MLVVNKKRHTNKVADVYGDGSVFIVDEKRDSDRVVTDVYGDGEVFIVNKKRGGSSRLVDVYGDGEVFIVNMTKDQVQQKKELDARIANFISLICNVNMMKQQMVQIGQLAGQYVIYLATNIFRHDAKAHTLTHIFVLAYNIVLVALI